jgi:membrane-associated phospholipid phosphatase
VTELHQKLDAAAIAPQPARKYRASIFQAYVLIASAGFIALAVAAHFVPYFEIDLKVTRALQSYHGATFDAVMRGISWLGFEPQNIVLGCLVFLVLLGAGLRWEAVGALFAAGVSVAGAAVKLLVIRPRPSADLVRVFSELPTTGFPSGHVLTAMGLGGFLGFLAYTLLKRSWGRTALLTAIALVILLMGPSRIYLGQHWFSDVMGAYVLGSLWLALSIKLYRRGKPMFFRGQTVAPAEPEVPSGVPEIPT